MAGAYAAEAVAAADEAYDTFVAVPLWMPLLAAGMAGAATFAAVAGLLHAALVVAEEAGLATAAGVLLAGLTSLPERVRRGLEARADGDGAALGRNARETCELVASAFVARGWSVELVGSGGAGAGGADLLLTRGEELLAAQVRGRGAAPMVVDDVQRLELATARYAAVRGIVVSVAAAEPAARSYAAEAGIDVIEAAQLLPAARQFAPQPSAPACPECGAPMEFRPSRFGSFWGCVSFPSCRGSRPAGD